MGAAAAAADGGTECEKHSRNGTEPLKTRLLSKLDSLLERWFPERRVFLRTDTDTRYIRLSPLTQFGAILGVGLFVIWSIFATAFLLIESIGSGNLREQAMREQEAYEARLNTLSAERDASAMEARDAHARFTQALSRISDMQAELLAAEERRAELEKGIGVLQADLRQALQERDEARQLAADARKALEDRTRSVKSEIGRLRDYTSTLDYLASALTTTAAERDQTARKAAEARKMADDLILEVKLMQERNDRIFQQLEDAVTVSLTPLDKMFRAAGLPTESILATIRQGYSGQGGPLTPLSFSTMGAGKGPDPDTLRANAILARLDRMNMYRIAAEKTPFAIPVHSAFRFTSGFGYRKDPKTGGRRMHKGTDFAAGYGTPIYATADGVVIKAGWGNGYGRVVEIRHAFGIETRYAHMSRIRVKVGDRVSRGQQIGDMGNSGRSTGTHLHYEIRIGGKAVNPMKFIKAAKDVL